jgi:ketosteroid isomerase-like protein
MSEQQNVEIVRRGYDAFSRGDIDALVALFDDQIEWISPGPPDLPTAGHRQGKAQVREFFATIASLLDFKRFEPTTFVAQGDRVVVLGEDEVTVKATGNPVSATWAHAFTLKNGKITHFHEYIDTAALVGELRAAQVHT